MYKIYKHTNLENGKIYIGQTEQEVEQRWQKGRGYKKSTRFFNAILEYGWKHFSHEIIEDGIKEKEKALEREQYWIHYYDSANPEKGYNMYSKDSTIKKPRKPYTYKNEETKRIHASNGCKKVQCIETNQIFNSLSDAAKWCGLKGPSNISVYLRGKSKSAGRHPITNEKLHWKFI